MRVEMVIISAGTTFSVYVEALDHSDALAKLEANGYIDIIDPVNNNEVRFFRHHIYAIIKKPTIVVAAPSLILSPASQRRN